MPSPGAVADAIEYSIRGHARVTAELAQQSLAATAAELQKANANIIETGARCWLWGARAKGLEEIVIELQTRYPNDPLFRQVGGVCPNGKPKMVLHQRLESAFARHMTAAGAEKARVMALLTRFLSRRPL